MANATAKKKPKAKLQRKPPEILQPIPASVDAPLSAETLWVMLGVCERTFKTMLSDKDFPACDLMVRGKARWLASTLNTWLHGERDKHKSGGIDVVSPEG